MPDGFCLIDKNVTSVPAVILAEATPFLNEKNQVITMFPLLNDYDLNALKRNESVVEKSIKDCLKARQHFSGEDFSKKDQDLTNLRTSQLKNIKTTLRHICEIMVSKKDFVKNIGHQTQEAQEDFKSDMHDLKSLILEQKKLFRNQILSLQQKSDDVDTELLYFYEKLPSWKEHTKSHVNLNFPIKKVSKPKQKFQEINDFFDFVHASGGKEGGWKREDHFLFIRLLMKFKKMDVVARVLNEMLPDISPEEVHNHFDWFVRYQSLLKSKKEVILKWKEEKLKNNKRSTESVDTKLIDQSTTKCDNRKNLKNALEERLKLWKAKKEEDTKRQKELEKRIKKEQKEKEKKNKQKQETIRNMVNQWKSINISLKEAEMKEKETLQIKECKTRSRTAIKLIKQFQSMDELRIQKMQKIRLKKEVPEPKRTKSGPLERLFTQRDPERLLKPTQQWINRVQNSTEENSVVQPIARSVLRMPKLHIPEWRKTIQ